jgi:hypothetical protein
MKRPINISKIFIETGDIREAQGIVAGRLVKS